MEKRNWFICDKTFRLTRLSDQVYLELTIAEFDIIYALMNRTPGVVTRDHILALIDTECKLELRTVDSHIKRIRRKMKNVFGTNQIRTRYGIGYEWHQEPTTRAHSSQVHLTPDHKRSA